MPSPNQKLDLIKAPDGSGPAGILSLARQRNDLFPWPLIAITVTAFLVVLPWCFQGVPSGHDFDFHLNSWMEVVSQWNQGTFYPRWAAMANHGFGEPRFVFYPPASWMLGATLGAVLPWKLVPGAYVWIVLTLSGCSMFLLARCWLGRQDAIFAAALYAANPYHLVIIYWRSAFAELLGAALLPLVILCVLRPRENGRDMVVPLGLIVSAAWLTNLPSAVMLNYSLALLLLVLAITRRSPGILLHGGAAVLLGTTLAAFYLVPAIYEQKWTDIAGVLAPGVRPQDNFLFTMIADLRHDRFNLLVSVVGFAELMVLAGSALLSWRRRREESLLWWTLTAWALAITMFMFPFTEFAWQHLPKLRFMQLPWRWLLCLNVSFVLLLAMAWRRWVPRALISMALLLVLASLWLLVQSPSWEETNGFLNMAVALQNGKGYDGTDEYLPSDSDAYAVKLDAPLVKLEDNGPARVEMREWTADKKLFSANVRQSGNLVLRVFVYPGWDAEVNGRAVETDNQDSTGQMLIPVESGENQVRVTFTHTWDRILGDIVSAIAAILTLICAFRRRRTRWTQPAS